MAMKLRSIIEMRMFRVTVSDDQEGDRIAAVGYSAHDKRAFVVSQSRVEKAQTGGSQFGSLPKEVELEFIRRVAPQDLVQAAAAIDAQLPIPGTEGNDTPRPNPAIPAKLKGR